MKPPRGKGRTGIEVRSLPSPRVRVRSLFKAIPMPATFLWNPAPPRCGGESKRGPGADRACQGRPVFFTLEGSRYHEPRASKYLVSGLHAEAVPRHSSAAPGSLFGKASGTESRASGVLRRNRALADGSLRLEARLSGKVRAALIRP